MQICKLRLLLIALIGASTPSIAKDIKKVASEEDYFAEIPSVIATTRLSQPKNEAPSSTTIIDRQMIELSGATSIAELLRLVPGMVVGYESGFKPIVSYHGLSTQYSRRMQVLVDGRSVYETGAGELMWEMLPLPLDDIERIEIIRGPSAASHGANAYLGVISITTRSASAEQGYSIDGKVGSSSYKEQLLRAGNVGEQLDYRVTAIRKDSDGIVDLDDRYDTTQLGFRADYRINKRSSINIFLGYGTLEGDQAIDFTPTHTLNRDVNFQQIQWRYRSNQFGEFLVQAYRNALEEKVRWDSVFPVRDNMGNITGFTPILFDQTVKEERRDFEFQHSLTLGNWQRVVWGGGIRRDIMSDNESFNTDEDHNIDLYRGFFNSESRLFQNTVLNFGMMVEKHEYANVEYSPRVAINQHLSANHTVRAGFSRAYRNPVLAEEKADLVFKQPDGTPVLQLIKSDGGLQSEIIDSYEIALMSNYPRKGLSIDYKLYYDELDNLIRTFSDPVTHVLRFSNRDAANVKGLEIQANYQINPETRLFASYAREEIESDDVIDNYTDSAPEHKVSLMLMKQIQQQLEGALIYHYHSKMEWLLNDPINEYHRWDLTASYKVRINRFDGKIGGAIRGVFGSTADHTPNVAFGPQMILSLHLHFL